MTLKKPNYDIQNLKGNLPGVVPDEDGLPLSSLQWPVLGEAYKFQFSRAIDMFYQSQWIKCQSHCKMLLDITWERLNTGHWKDINISWRYAYTLVSLLKGLSEYASYCAQQGVACDQKTTAIPDAIKTCDMGLIMGAPLMDNILTKVIHKLQEKHTELIMHSCVDAEAPQKKRMKLEAAVPRPDIEPENLISTVKDPPLHCFLTDYMDTETPVILEDCMGFWPALSTRKWSLDYIKRRAGCRTVPIEVGSKYTEDSWSQALMTIQEFIEKYIENPVGGDAKGYLAQHQLFEQIPELCDDIATPSYCGLESADGTVDVNAWFGPAGTVSPLHQDPKHNLLCQVQGEKYIRMYSTRHTELIYPHDSPIFSNTSQVDVENPDLVKFPAFAKAPFVECILKPGQMLYIPPKYWHYVRSLATSFSVSFWWGCEPLCKDKDTNMQGFEPRC